MSRQPLIPDAPNSIQKGVPLRSLLGDAAIECLAHNIVNVYPEFQGDEFCRVASTDLEPLELMGRGLHIAKAMNRFLPDSYSEAVEILIWSMTPPAVDSELMGLAGFFYLPHGFFVAEYGLDKIHNGGADPFESSMRALRELTMRFTAEFAIRNFLIHQEDRTLETISTWLADPNPHVRRLCSEGTRPRLPWGKRIPAFVKNPEPTLFILEALKNDPSLYVRRSVANHLGDIGKDHPLLAFSICDTWLEEGASKDLKWLIRHAVRYHAKKGDPRAIEIRQRSV